MTTPYINPNIPITLLQAQEIVDMRSNGGLEPGPEGTMSPAGEWCLAELEAFTIVRRVAENKLHVTEKTFQLDPFFGYSEEAAQQLVTTYLNEKKKDLPHLAGVSESKGGRAWMDGIWHIAELEALCAHLRYSTGCRADGAVTTLANSLYFDVTPTFDESQLATAGDIYGLLVKMLNAGINPSVVPRIFEKFIEHTRRGWSLPRIVCAANQLIVRDTAGKIRSHILPSARHGGRIMADLLGLLGLHHDNRDPAGLDPFITESQGFIDQHDNFYTRQEAWTIAMFHGQIQRDAHWRYGTLCSENLY